MTDLVALIQYLQQNWLEVAGVITGFIWVYLNARENIWGWPVGIISCFLYIFIMYHARLYADTWLQVVYVLLNMYGWYQWLHGGTHKQVLPVSHITRSEAIVLLPGGLLLTVISYSYFSAMTHAAQPFWDSFNTAFSLVALYLQAKKRLESWLAWILVDVIYVPLFFFRGLLPTAGLYTAYLILAVMGYLMWRRSMPGTSVHKIKI